MNIPLKKYTCSLNGYPKTIQDPYINLYIKITDDCPASCKFCEFSNKEDNAFDIDKLLRSIKMLRKRYRINKVAFTGGEPTSKFDELKSAIIQVSKLLPKTEMTINTNGVDLYKFSEKLLKKISVIALSRHHYNDKENYNIFRTEKVPSFQGIKNFPDKNKLHMRCNLIKGFIDNKESLIKYIDYFSEIGISDFGFVPLFLLNDYCKDNFIPFEKTEIDFIPNSRLVREWAYDDCHCKNYIAYTEKGKLVRYYARSNREPGTCESTVVYDKDRLRVGFKGEIINI